MNDKAEGIGSPPADAPPRFFVEYESWIAPDRLIVLEDASFVPDLVGVLVRREPDGSRSFVFTDASVVPAPQKGNTDRH